MLCHCCDQDVANGRKAKVRCLPTFDPSGITPRSPAYLAYEEAATYRWGWVCESCYERLDNDTGVETINGRTFGLAGASRGGKAHRLDEAAYRAFQRREAEKMGIGVTDD